MAVTTFQERLARIEARQETVPQHTPARFCGAGKPARRKAVSRGSRVRSNLTSMATGGVLGVLMGVLMQGAVQPGSPWGPGAEYSALLGMTGMGGLLSALPLVLISVYLRRSRPGFFFFSVAYAAAAILTALI